MMSSVITLRLNRCATTASTVRTTVPASRTAARHPPGCGGTSASGVLFGRVHVPLQSPNLQKSRQAILSAHATGSNQSADDLCRISGTLRKANGRATTGSGYLSEVDSQSPFFPCRRATKKFVVQKTDKWDRLYFKST